MIRRSLVIVGLCFLSSCTAPDVPVATAPSRPYLEPIRLDDPGIAFAEPISVRMQGTGRRDFTLRMRMDLLDVGQGLSAGLTASRGRPAPGWLDVGEGLSADLTYRGSVRTAARPDNRSEFAIFVDAIDGAVSFTGPAPSAAQRVELRERDLSVQVFGSIHNTNNSFHQINLPLLTLLDEQAGRPASSRGDVEMARLFALKMLSDNISPLLPIRKSRLAVGEGVWPTSYSAWRDLLDREYIPALSRSPQFREMFDRLPARERGGFNDFDSYMRNLGEVLSAVFGGSDTTLGGRISGTRVWNGQDVLEAEGPVRMTLSIGSGASAVAIRVNGENHLLIDPYAGITVRSEYTVAARLVAANARSMDLIQQISSTISPPLNSLRIPVASAAAVASPPRGDVPGGRIPRRISEIYSTSIGAIYMVSAGSGIGSGFAVGHDLVLTNRHVVEGRAGGWVDLVQGGRRVARARVEKVFDGVFDLALLRTERPLEVVPLELARDLPAIGTEVLIIGSPVGLEGSITGGLVSHIRPLSRASYLQVDAALNPGNSGGPVLDRLGRVIGMATMRLEPGAPASAGNRPVIGIGFALSAETIRELLSSARISVAAEPR
jgi:S1-C subfamily serine protease